MGEELFRGFWESFRSSLLFSALQNELCLWYWIVCNETGNMMKDYLNFFNELSLSEKRRSF